MQWSHNSTIKRDGVERFFCGVFGSSEYLPTFAVSKTT